MRLDLFSRLAKCRVRAAIHSRGISPAADFSHPCVDAIGRQQRGDLLQVCGAETQRHPTTGPG